MGPVLASPLAYGTNWIHLAVVFDGTDWMVYTNGIKTGTKRPQDPIQGWDKNLLIGRGGFALDDFRIYSYALASDEIAGLIADEEKPTLQISTANGKTILRWRNGNQRYRVDYSTSLSEDAVWTPLSNPINYLNEYSQIELPIVAEKRFYRLRKL